MSKPKATKAEMEARTSAVLTLLVNGADRPEIIKHMADKHQLNERSTDEAIKRATAVLEAEAKVQRAVEIGKAIRRLNLVFKKAMNVQDYRVALSAQSQLSDLLALQQPQTVKIISEALSPADAKLLSELLEMLKSLHGVSAGDVFAAMMRQVEARAKAANEQPH